MKQDNVLFVTLDSCRYDSMVAANAPIMKSIGPLRKAKTHGTYTLPAHISFFMGYLPSVLEPPFLPYYSREVKQLFRLHSATDRHKHAVEFFLESGDDVISGLRQQGYLTIGAGGVSWFRHALLQNLFEHFHYWSTSTSRFTERNDAEFALSHADTYLEHIAREKRCFCLFLNCHETYCPYDFGEGFHSERVRVVMDKYHYCRNTLEAITEIHEKKPTMPPEFYQALHAAQVASIECIDKKLGHLLKHLPKPLWVVIAGDHGESFGEQGLWGHGYAVDSVLTVPLIIGRVS